MSDAVARLLLLGEVGCGKTLLAQKLSGQEPDFNAEYNETECLNDALNAEIEDGDIPVIIVDSPGLSYDRFLNTTRAHVAECQLIALLIDITSQKSLDNIKLKYLEIVREQLEKGEVNAALALVATKGDLETDREVESHMANVFAKDGGLTYFEVSAKTGEGIPELLRFLNVNSRTFNTTKVTKRFQKTKKQVSKSGSSGGGQGEDAMKTTEKKSGMCTLL